MIVRTIAIAGLIAALSGLNAFAQKPQRIEQFNAWGAYRVQMNDNTVCFVLSMPSKKEPEDRDHGDVFFMVSQKPGQNIDYEPHLTVGYPFADESKVTVNIDGKGYDMFTRGSKAWMWNAAEEPEVVQAMRAGSQMVVSGRSRRGTETKYTYSLSGITASLKKIGTCK